jgi:serine/threonine protein kinase
MAINPKDILPASLAAWDIKRTLGTGGFKEVFLVENNGLKEALKITRYFDEKPMSQLEADDLETQLRARTEREYQLLKEFGGGCIVSLGSIVGQEVEVNGKKYNFYSEEYLPGKTLSDVNIENKSSGHLPATQMVKTLFLTGIKVIEKIWAKKVVHRDIKPLNIMMTESEGRSVVFFDLGIAFDRAGTSLTSLALGPGTLRYRAPESLDPDYRASIDFRCDLFSLAVTVYEYAAGFHPLHHGSTSEGETVYRLLNRNADKLYTKRPDLGQDLCATIDKCLHKKPALRPVRLGDIKRMLEE